MVVGRRGGVGRAAVVVGGGGGGLASCRAAVVVVLFRLAGPGGRRAGPGGGGLPGRAAAMVVVGVVVLAVHLLLQGAAQAPQRQTWLPASLGATFTSELELKSCVRYLVCHGAACFMLLTP